MRLEREANQKIAELAERAQTEAVTNLGHTTTFVHTENMKLNEELSRQIQVLFTNQFLFHQHKIFVFARRI